MTGSPQGEPEAWKNAITIDKSTFRGTEGFIRVAQSEGGRWWLIDPDGSPFIYKGVTSVNRGLKPNGKIWGPLSRYNETLNERFGTDIEGLADETVELIRSVGFNGFGAWTAPEFFGKGPFFTEIVESRRLKRTAEDFGETITIKSPGVNVPDVFDPRWEKAYDRECAAACPSLRNSRELVGYFTDNELGWGQAGIDEIWGGDNSNLDGRKPTLLQACLALPEDRPAAVRAWEFVLARHDNDPDRLARDWQIEFGTPEHIAQLTHQGIALSSKGYAVDHNAFSTLFAQTYVRKTSETIRRYDPNHLIVGPRFGAPPRESILQAFAPPHVDIISMNNYRHTFYERLEEYYRTTNMPIINGEFAWVSPYFREIPYPGEPSEGISERDRVKVKGRESLERAFTHPGLVGYTWFRWVTTRNKADDFSYGLVTQHHELNTLNAELLRTTNPRLERIAAGLEEPCCFL